MRNEGRCVTTRDSVHLGSALALDLDLQALTVNTRRGFRGPETCKLVGISYRQLDYWARTSLVIPSIADAWGSGSQRLYSEWDLRRLYFVKLLVNYGLTLGMCANILQAVREGDLDDERVIKLNLTSGKFISEYDPKMPFLAPNHLWLVFQFKMIPIPAEET